MTPRSITRELHTLRHQLAKACRVDARYRAYIRQAIARLDKLSAAILLDDQTRPGPKPRSTPAATVAPYPNISAAAHVLMIRAPGGQLVTVQTAVVIVGPYLAADAVAELEAKHLLDEGQFTPLAAALRRWDRKRGPP